MRDQTQGISQQSVAMAYPSPPGTPEHGQHDSDVEPRSSGGNGDLSPQSRKTKQIEAKGLEKVFKSSSTSRYAYPENDFESDAAEGTDLTMKTSKLFVSPVKPGTPDVERTFASSRYAHAETQSKHLSRAQNPTSSKPKLQADNFFQKPQKPVFVQPKVLQKHTDSFLSSKYADKSDDTKNTPSSSAKDPSAKPQADNFFQKPQKPTFVQPQVLDTLTESYMSSKYAVKSGERKQSSSKTASTSTTKFEAKDFFQRPQKPKFVESEVLTRFSHSFASSKYAD